MNARARALHALARQLLNGQSARLDAGELDALLSWLSGSQLQGAGQLAEVLGRPEERPQRVAEVYAWLDRQLFASGRLNWSAAHVSSALPASERKARLRRLIQAFHPDRYPQLAAWLTPRSQVIHQAYVAFKRGDEEATASAAPARPATRPQRKSTPGKNHAWQPGSFRHSARLVPVRIGPLRRLLHWCIRTPRLSVILVGGLASVALLPLIFLSLADNPAASSAPTPRADHPAAPDPSPPSSELLPARLAVDRTGAAMQFARAGSERSGPGRAPTPEPAPAPELMEARIEALLQRFSAYVNGGDLDGLLGLLAETPAEQEARRQIAARYGQVIESSRRRHQEFQILAIEQRPPDWSVQALSRLTMAFENLTARHEETRYRVTIRHYEDGQLRIAALDD